MEINNNKITFQVGCSAINKPAEMSPARRNSKPFSMMTLGELRSLICLLSIEVSRIIQSIRINLGERPKKLTVYGCVEQLEPVLKIAFSPKDEGIVPSQGVRNSGVHKIRGCSTTPGWHDSSRPMAKLEFSNRFLVNETTPV